MEEIRIISEPLGEGPVTILTGFPGSGLVGSIALQYIVDELKYEHIGNITSKYFPPVVMMANGLVNVPTRIYRKDNFIAIISDIPLHAAICYEVANGIIEWAQQTEIKEIVPLAGIITNEPEKRVFGVATDEQSLEDIKEKTQLLPLGSISGLPSSLLTECKLRDIPGFSLLGETVNSPDPRGAASIVSVLNELYSFDLAVEQLLEQATELEAALQAMAEQVQQTEQEQAVPKKEHLPMYG